MFSKLVQGLSVMLTIANDGREALDQAKARPFDIVFMDMRMPEMDGLDATRAIRALGGAWRTIPIVALTANAFPEDVKMCRDAGMNDFLSKPVRKRVLVDRLAALLADHPLLRAAIGPRVPLAPAVAGALRAAPRPPTPLTEPAPVLDRAIVHELMEGMGAKGMQAMFGIFRAETAARLDNFRTLTREHNLVRIVDEAHTLKGAAGTTGLSQLSELAESLEHTAASIAPADYANLVDRIEVSFQSACAAIDRELASMTAPA